MKWLIVSLITLTSLSTYAQGPEVVCGAGQDGYIRGAIRFAKDDLDYHLKDKKIKSMSVPVTNVVIDSSKNINASICVTIDKI